MQISPLAITIIVTSLVFIAMSPWRFTTMKIIDTAIGFVMIISTIAMLFSYSNYTPADSPGCQVKPMRYGVVKAGADITNYTIDDVQAPALSFNAAMTAYQGPLNGFRSGYFAWNGKVARILKTTAGEITNDTKNTGDWWVFGDYNNITVK